MTLYHYTIADRLMKILIGGHLKLTPREDSELLEEGEARAVWLTSNPEWDKTAFYGYPIEAIEASGKIRISVDFNAKHSNAEVASHRLGNWESLVWSAGKVGVDHCDWYVSFEEVCLNEFTNIELWKDGAWVKIPMLIQGV